MLLKTNVSKVLTAFKVFHFLRAHLCEFISSPKVKFHLTVSLLDSRDIG